MSLKKKFLIASLIMFVVGALLLVFGDTRGPEPQIVCAEAGGPTSGFSTEACPDGTTIESQREWFDWNSEPRYGRLVGLGIVGLSIVAAITGAVMPKKKPTVKSNDNTSK